MGCNTKYGMQNNVLGAKTKLCVLLNTLLQYNTVLNIIIVCIVLLLK